MPEIVQDIIGLICIVIVFVVMTYAIFGAIGG